MLSGSSSSTVISLLSETSDQEESLYDDPTTIMTRKGSRKLEIKVSEVSLSGASVYSPDMERKSCAHRSLEFMFGIDLYSFLGPYMTESEVKLFDHLKTSAGTIPSIFRVLGTLLARQWPKWQLMRFDDEVTLHALVQMRAVYSLESVSDWVGTELESMPLDTSHALLSDIKSPFMSCNLLDLLLDSVPASQLRVLRDLDKSSISRSALKESIKASYDGTQRTIFGARNDIHSLIRKINKVCETDGMRLVILDPEIRRLFMWISFALDIDAEDETIWNSALPQTLLKGYANKNIGSVLTSRQLGGRMHVVGAVPECMRIWTSRNHIDVCRLLTFLHLRVEQRKVCPRTVAGNVRQFMTTVDLEWNRESHPEWWWRRQTPRRCSNVIWKCIAELERLKQYDVCIDHLEYLLQHGDVLLGRKRRGKVAIRYLIELGHVGRDSVGAGERILESCDLFPADRAEIQRRMSGLSIHRFGWPCGSVNAVTIVIPGAKSRNFNWVEQAALDHHYTTPGNGYSGAHCEGRIMMEIFRNLFSSILVPQEMLPDTAILQTPLQRWALDVGFLSDSSDRWPQIQHILDEISERDFSDLSEYFLRRKITESDHDLPQIISCITGKILAHIMRLMITDPFYWGGGQPDLLIWSVEKREIIFAEVKGPGDQLSPRQRWWLSELTKAGARAEVCYVTDEKPEPVPKKLRKKKREFSAKNNDVVELD